MDETREERIRFIVHGTSDYTIDAIRYGEVVSIRCTCPAFVRPGKVHYMACKHVLRILLGSQEGMLNPLTEDVERLEEWLLTSTLGALLAPYRASASPDGTLADAIREELRRAHKHTTSSPAVRAGKPRDAVSMSSADALSPVFIDIETTGLYPGYGDRVIEIAIVAEDGSVLLEELVDPQGRPSTPKAFEKHGIKDAELIGKPRLHELASRIADCVRDKTVVGWNVDFERSFLGELLDHAADVVDAMSRFGMGKDRVRMDEAIDHIGYHWEGSQHRALPDALACRAVWRWLDEKGAPLRPEPVRPKGAERVEAREQLFAAIESRLQALEHTMTVIPALRDRIEELERALLIKG